MSALKAAGIADPSWKLKGAGWSLGKTNLEDCKKACDVLGCAEITFSGARCFFGKSVCYGDERVDDAKWILKTSVPEGCPTVAPTAAPTASPINVLGCDRSDLSERQNTRGHLPVRCQLCWIRGACAGWATYG